MSDESRSVVSNLSDEEDDSYNDDSDSVLATTTYGPVGKSGTLSKWTNYMHGWQLRYTVLKDNSLTYYKTESDTSYGCRGAISIQKASVRPHEFDECRFDVSANDCVWHLRAETVEERQVWVDALEAYKAESGYSSENNLRRHGSSISLASASLSFTSTSSFKKGGRGLKEKLAEVETFRDILCSQTDRLQRYFDACAGSVTTILQKESNGVIVNGLDDDLDDFESMQNGDMYEEINHLGVDRKKELAEQHCTYASEFKGEAGTFKATTAGIIATLAQCITLMNEREENWKRRLEKEVERRRKFEELYRQAINEAEQRNPLVLDGPDYEEGPHSAINEEVFFDAVDAALDKMDYEEEKKNRNRFNLKQPPKKFLSLTQHPLWPEIDKTTNDELHYARMEVGEGGWTLLAEEGEMRMYRLEMEEEGRVVDPLKAVHSVKGVTAHEMCHYFFDPAYRHDWDTNVETVTVIEKIAENTNVCYQTHKRVWPTAQRDSLFWSHVRHVPNEEDKDDGDDVYMACLKTTDYPEPYLSSAENTTIDYTPDKYVRIRTTVSIMCQTIIDPEAKKNKTIGRDDLTCKITYCAKMNPGGWTPASVLRAIYKREYPKFVKRFTEYVKEQTENKPIMF